MRLVLILVGVLFASLAQAQELTGTYATQGKNGLVVVRMVVSGARLTGTLEQRKEFLRGFVHEIGIDPDAGRGVITFYELPAGSLMMVPGLGVEPRWPEGQGILSPLRLPVSPPRRGSAWR